MGAVTDDEKQESVVTEDQEWDPHFLMRAKKTEPTPMDIDEVRPPDDEVPTATSEDGTHSEASSVRRQRRQPRLGQEVPSTPTPPAKSPTPLTPMPDVATMHIETGLFDNPTPGSEARVFWLIVGAGVTFTEDARRCKGFISKVYANEAHITMVEGLDELPKGVIRRPGPETSAWHCDKRGQQGMVFDGPHIGHKGKIIGFEGNFAWLLSESEQKQGQLYKATSGSKVVKVDRKDIVQYCLEPPRWDGRAKAEPPSLSVSEGRSSRQKDDWLGDQSWEAGVREAAQGRAPLLQPAPQSPHVIEEDASPVVVADTPIGLDNWAETPMSEASGARTPLMSEYRQRGQIAPKDSFTPLEAKDQTPMTPGPPGPPGDQTPFAKKKEETPLPLPGVETPSEGVADVEIVTPLTGDASGSVTPMGPPEGIMAVRRRLPARIFPTSGNITPGPTPPEESKEETPGSTAGESTPGL